MSTTDIRVRTGRARETAGSASAGTYNAVRADVDGSVFTKPLLSPAQGAGLSGEYLVATNPTPGTAIATTTSITAYTVASPVLMVENENTDKRLILDHLNMGIVQVPSSATEWQFLWLIDTVQRYSSAGSELTPVNVNTAVGNTTGAKVYFGALVSTGATTTQRIHSNGTLQDVVPVTLSSTTFLFGSAGVGGGGNYATGTLDRVVRVPPLVVGPGGTASLYLYGASNAAAPSWEFTLGFIEA